MWGSDFGLGVHHFASLGLVADLECSKNSGFYGFSGVRAQSLGVGRWLGSDRGF